MKALEEKLHHTFRDAELLRTALTHSSYANEHGCASNERLEFVGDSVLGMVTAAFLYRTFPTLPEGRMTRLRAELVCEQSLWEVAERIGLGDHLRLGRGEELTGGRTRHSILADCVEAVIAAIYLDEGLNAAKSFIDGFILSKLTDVDISPIRDYKTELQELVQREPGRSVSYVLTGESGPDHRKRFMMTACLDGKQLGSGEGGTKKEAEQMAAKSALEQLNQP